MPYVLHEGMDDYLTPLSENQFPPVGVVSGKRIKVHQTDKWTGDEDGVDMGEVVFSGLTPKCLTLTHSLTIQA